MSVPKPLDSMTRFERGVLFRIARWVAFSVCLALFLGMLAGAAYFAVQSVGGSEGRPTVQGVLGPAIAENSESVPDAGQTESVTEDSSLAGLRFSPELQELLTRPQFKGWLESNMSMVGEGEREWCAEGMGQALTQGRSRQMADNDVISTWMDACRDYSAKVAVDRAARTTRMMYAAGAVGLLLTLLACYSLVLILIAIERNTRPSLAP